MSLSLKLILLGVIIALLGLGGVRVYRYVYNQGYDRAVSERRDAEAKADAKLKKDTEKESAGAASVIASGAKRRVTHSEIQRGIDNLPKPPITITEEPVNDVKVLRVYGLSDDGLRLFNDAVRGETTAPKVRQIPPEALQR